MLEILAPVGSMNALKAALYSGADAVYLGMSKFNARQKAENFNENNIKETVDLCHLFGVKVYITFNTLIKDGEFSDFEKVVDTCAKANVDAFIVTDLGTLNIFKKYNIPLHASTQMGIHNYEGALIAKKLGFSRVILSREALLSDIKKISTLDIEIEYFVHGALCVSFSGGCLLSSFLSGDSGNRGLCKQPCRLMYKSSLTNEEKYYLSPSDQCLIEQIKILQEAGVCSLKIEGRLKGAQYVGEVVRQYRNALDGKLENNYKEELKRAYNRGNFTSGYNFDSTKDIMSIFVQGNVGDNIGKIVGYEGKGLVIQSDRGLFIGDGIKIFNNDLELGGFLIDNVKEKNGKYIVNTIKKYPINSNIHLTLDINQVKKYENIKLKRKIALKYLVKENEPFKLICESNGVVVEKSFDKVLKADNKPVDCKTLDSKLCEIGDSNFVVSSIKGELVGDCFIPMSKIKEAKREIIKSLENEILKAYNQQKIKVKFDENKLEFLNNKVQNNTFIEVSDLNIISQNMSKYEVVLNLNKIQDLGAYFIKNDLNYKYLEKLWLKLPKIARNGDVDLIRKFIENNNEFIKGFVCENIYGLEFCLEYNKIPMLGIGMNMFNKKVCKNLNVSLGINSLELSKNELVDNFVYSYGVIPLMTFTHCPIQLNTGCNCANCKYKGDFYYSNRENNFRVVRHKLKYCYFEMYHSKVLSLLNENIRLKYLNAENLSRSELNSLLNNDISNINSFKGHFDYFVK